MLPSASLRHEKGQRSRPRLILCGQCGERMTVRSQQRRGQRIVPDYLCQSKSIAQGRTPCQRIPGSQLDPAIGALLIERVTPQALALTLAVQEEVIQRADAARRLRQRPRRTCAL